MCVCVCVRVCGFCWLQPVELVRKQSHRQPPRWHHPPNAGPRVRDVCSCVACCNGFVPTSVSLAFVSVCVCALARVFTPLAEFWMSPRTRSAARSQLSCSGLSPLGNTTPRHLPALAVLHMSPHLLRLPAQGAAVLHESVLWQSAADVWSTAFPCVSRGRSPVVRLLLIPSPSCTCVVLCAGRCGWTTTSSQASCRRASSALTHCRKWEAVCPCGLPARVTLNPPGGCVVVVRASVCSSCQTTA